MSSPVLGIDIGGTNIKFGLVNEAGELLETLTVTTPHERDLPQIVQVCAKGTRELFAMTKLRPVGVGVAAPGVVDIAEELVIEAPNFTEWNHAPLRQAMSDVLKLPAVLGNDVQLLAVAEHRWGAAVGFKNFIATAVGTGVGGAIFINGQLYRGARGGAGEVGFTIIAPDGPAVAGVPGVVEGFVGRRGFDEIVNRLFPSGEFPTPRRITDLANAGDQRACQVQDIIANYLAEAVATWLHLFNPEAVILGGGTLAGAIYFFEIFEQKLKARARPTHMEGVKILPAKLGYYAGVQGAAAWWMISNSQQKE